MDTQPITSMAMLINEFERLHPRSYFFDKHTLKFFGERLSDMRLLKGTAKIETPSGDKHICYMVSSRQQKAPGGPKRVYHYFDVNTLDHIIKE